MNKKTNWKLLLIIGAGIVAVILLCVFGVQSFQNRAFAFGGTGKHSTVGYQSSGETKSRFGVQPCRLRKAV